MISFLNADGFFRSQKTVQGFGRCFFPSSLYLDPPRGAKWMVRGATKQSLRVQSPPLQGVLVCNYNLTILKPLRFFMHTSFSTISSLIPRSKLRHPRISTPMQSKDCLEKQVIRCTAWWDLPKRKRPANIPKDSIGSDSGLIVTNLHERCTRCLHNSTCTLKNDFFIYDVKV